MLILQITALVLAFVWGAAPDYEPVTANTLSTTLFIVSVAAGIGGLFDRHVLGMRRQ